MKSRRHKIGVIILAAGNSSRMNGQPKQMLMFGGKTFLRHSVETALQAKFEKIVVVLGSSCEDFTEQIEDLAVDVVINKNAPLGMSSSIKAGLSVISEDDFDAVLITLCDQPLITEAILANIADKYIQTRKPIIASEYENTFGVPALFDRKFFSELMNLKSDEGAKKLIKKYSIEAEFFLVPEAGVDIDTTEDYLKLIDYDFDNA